MDIATKNIIDEKREPVWGDFYDEKAHTWDKKSMESGDSYL